MATHSGILAWSSPWTEEPGRLQSKGRTELDMTEATEQRVCVLSCVQLLETPLTVARQAPLSMGFLRQEYWSGLPFPPPEDLPNPGIEPTSPVSPALTGRLFTAGPPGWGRVNRSDKG